jgi:hypothetical protein
MTGKEALTALKQSLGIVPVVHCNTWKNEPCLDIESSRYVPAQRYIAGIQANNSEYTLNIFFTPSYPFNPDRPEMITSIGYQPNLRSDADKSAFVDKVLEKYGRPTTASTSPSGVSFYASASWCIRAETYTTGGYQTPQSVHYTCNDSKAPVLSMSESSVGLTDETVNQKEFELWNSKKKTTSPPL